MGEIKKHLLLYGRMVKNCGMQQLEYRSNFIINILGECVYVCAKLLYVVIVYQVGSDINGLSAQEIKLFIGTFMLLTAVYTGFFMNNFYAVSTKVRNGELDMMITKPVSLQFYVTLQKVNVALPIPNLIAGGTLVCTAWAQAGIPVTVRTVGGYLVLLALGTLLTYSLFLAPQLLSFWIVKTGAVVEVTDKLWDFNNMPMSIYGTWMQRIGTFLIPVFVITNFPVMSLMSSLTPVQTVWAVAAPVLFFLLVRLGWKRSLRQYSSAGG